jgi:hypothetical protein
MLIDIFINICSDFIFLLIAIGIGWLFYLITKRFELLRFFGIEKTHRVVIYLSNIRVKKFGSIGIDGKERSYNSPSGAFGEIHVANRFRDLFNFILPSISDNPGILGKLLISDVKVQILQSPLKQGELETSTTLITLGSPAYNIASGFVENYKNSRAKFGLGVSSKKKPPNTQEDANTILPTTHSMTVERTVIDTMSPTPSGTASPFQVSHLSSSPSGLTFEEKDLEEKEPEISVDNIPPITDITYGFVQRIKDSGDGRIYFYIAGLSELGTVGAADYLINNWHELCRKYGCEKDFLVMLRFNPIDYKKWTIAFEH